jgi:MFS family permease
MNKKLNFKFLLFFILIYANQGIVDLPSQCLYYITREEWKLSATMLGLITFITSLAWYIKPLLGFASDFFSVKKRLKKYLLINTLLIILATLYLVFFGLNLYSLIIATLFINIGIAGNDVSCDKVMVKTEQKYNLNGRVQSVQWSALGFAGLFVSLFGAIIAAKLPETYNYKLAFLLTLIIPIILLIYVFKYFKETKEKINKIKFNFNILKNKEFIIGIIFIMLLRFSPSFGTALMIKLRETVGVDKLFLGYLGATGTVLGIIGYILYYKIGYKFPLRKMLYFTIVFSGLTNLCYLYIPNQWILILYNVMFGAIDGVCFLAIMSFMTKIVPVGYEGISYALVASINNLSSRMGGVFGGIIYDNFGYNYTVILASITTLLCLFIVPYLIIKKPKLDIA